jgi:hypothetical protein
MEKKQKLLPLNISIHASFEDARKFYEEDGQVQLYLNSKERPTVPELAKGSRNLIVGEPGMGKTTLLEELEKSIKEKGIDTCWIQLKDNKCVERINSFLSKEVSPETRRSLFLDGFDEVSANNLSEVIGVITDLSKPENSIDIYLTSRWHFVKRHIEIASLGYRFLAISPLSQATVRSVLIESEYSENDIESLMGFVVSFGHGDVVIQTPRYLIYFISYIKEKGLKNINDISRNDLFEYFIDKKLASEDAKYNSEKRVILKRMLEKLALVMEIYQVNSLKKDDLMTFLDDIQSDLKTHLLTQIPLEKLFDNSILKNNTDALEFDNLEFQEFLAARELSRFSDVQKAASDLVIDSITEEIQPSWFNTLNFLVDFKPKSLLFLMEFSRLKTTPKALNESFFSFLSKVNFSHFSDSQKEKIFTDVFEYHQRLKLWLRGSVSLSIARCSTSAHIPLLKSYATKVFLNTDTEEKNIQLSNLAYTIGAILEVKPDLILSEKDFWKSLLSGYAVLDTEGGVLERHALEALGRFQDSTIIDELPNLLNKDELVAQTFIRLCTRLDSDHEKTVQYLIEAVKKNIFYGEMGLIEVKKIDAIKVVLTSLTDDEVFRHEFIKDFSFSFAAPAVVQIISNIEAVFNDDISNLLMRLLVVSLESKYAYEVTQSDFFVELFKLLNKKRSDFIVEYIQKLKRTEKSNYSLFSAQELIRDAIGVDDVPKLISAMKRVSKRQYAADILISIKLSNRENTDQIYEAGRSEFSKEFSEWEAKRAMAPDNYQSVKAYEEFLSLLEPGSGKYNSGVFQYFVDNNNFLGSRVTEADKSRLKNLILGSVLDVIDPSKCEMSMNDNTITTNGGIFHFCAALRAAQILDLDVSKYRQKLINFIPFAYSDDLELIFGLVGNILEQELKTVITIYKDKSSDLGKYRPMNLVTVSSRFFLVGAVPILKDFVTESSFDYFTRRSALEACEMLVPDAAFLRLIFSKYWNDAECNDFADQLGLAIVANGLLITVHQDNEAIKWRIEEVVKRAQPFIKTQGLHNVSALEDEIYHDKEFAKPLMNLPSKDYVEVYVKLFDEVVNLWQKGNEYHAYADYLWGIIFSYFEKLVVYESYAPLQRLEEKVLSLKEKVGVNWFAGRLPILRRLYLDKIAKPKGITEAIKIYNKQRDRDHNLVNDYEGLFQLLKEIIDTDLRKWIEGEGAYELIVGEKVFDTKKQRYEELIQKTIKTQLENLFIKKGLVDINIDREEQLYDDKRVDFLIRYGFIGPIVLETKLASSHHLRIAALETSPSYKNMERYMSGYGATEGIFLVINNNNEDRTDDIKKAYEKIKGVHVLSIDCIPKTELNTDIVKKKPVREKSTKKS